MQHRVGVGEAPVDLRVQQRFGRGPRVGRDRTAVEIDDHDVVAAEPALVATRNRDRDVLRIEPHRKIAAGRRRPAERGELAAGVGDRARAGGEGDGIVGKGRGHG